MDHHETGPHDVLSRQAFVRNLSRSLVFDVHDAEDVAQEAWLRTLEREDGERGPRARLRALVGRMAWRRNRGEARRTRRERAIEPSPSVPTPDEILRRESLRRELVDAVLALEEAYRVVMILRYFEELPPREIARRLDIPVETVRTRHRRALGLLRTRLDSSFGSREAWCVALLALPFVQAPVGVGGGAGAGASGISQALTGVAVMSAKAKMVTSMAAVVGCVAFVWWIGRDADDRELEKEAAGALVAEEGDREDVRRRRAESEASTEAAEGTVPAVDAPEPSAAEAAPVTAPGTGALLVRTVWKDGKGPVPNVGLRFLIWGRPNPYGYPLYAKTDERGELRLRDLHVGGFSVESLAGGLARGKLVADEQAELVIEIPKGLAVDGVVVDAEDRPVAGASISVGDIGDDGMPITRSDPAGRFSLASTPADTWTCIGATAPGHGPSPYVILLAKPGSKKTIRLKLTKGGTNLETHVVGADGAPLKGAIVQLTWKNSQFGNPDGTRARWPLERRRVTDADGRARIDGIRPGGATLVVVAAGHGPVTRRITCAADGTHRERVELERAVTVEGRVTGVGGDPARGVVVTVGDGYDLGGARARTKADGTYELVGVAAGSIEVKADGDEAGRARRTISGGPGDVLTCDLRLSRGKPLRVRVTDPGGTARVGWQVRIDGAGKDWEHKDGKTDESGRITFSDCRLEKYRLEVRTGTWTMFPVAYRKDVAPGDEEVLFEISDAESAAQSITGRIVGPDDVPIANARVSAYCEGQPNSPVFLSDLEGRFTITGCPPRDYTVSVRSKEFPSLSRKVTVVGGTDLDVGDLVMRPGGTCVVVLSREVDPEKPLYVRLRRPDGSGQRWLRVKGVEAHSEQLDVGDWDIELQIPGKSAIEGKAVIRAGQQTRVDLTVP